jgi:hypothetical protein
MVGNGNHLRKEIVVTKKQTDENKRSPHIQEMINKLVNDGE